MYSAACLLEGVRILTAMVQERSRPNVLPIFANNATNNKLCETVFLHVLATER